MRTTTDQLTECLAGKKFVKGEAVLRTMKTHRKLALLSMFGVLILHNKIFILFKTAKNVLLILEEPFGTFSTHNCHKRNEPTTFTVRWKCL